jgi:hypothetical protein
MGSQQPYKSYDEKPNLIKRIDEWLEEKTSKSLKHNSMDIQQPYKSSDLMKKIDEWELRYDIKELKGSLKELVEKALEKAGISEPERFDASIGLHYNKEINEPINKPMRNVHNYFTYPTKDFYNKGGYNYFAIYIYDKDNKEIGSCYLYTIPNKIICTNYNGKQTELYDPQTISFLKSIKDQILDIFNISFPGVLKNLSNQHNQYMNIITYVSMNLKDLKNQTQKNPNQIQESPEISINGNEFIYRDHISNIDTRWYLINSSKS